MKAGFLAVAAAIASGVSAKGHKHSARHNHEAFHAERGIYATGVYSTGVAEATCGCTTIVSTVYGEATRTKNLLSKTMYKKKLNNV
jgi:hypothetical protein